MRDAAFAFTAGFAGGIATALTALQVIPIGSSEQLVIVLVALLVYIAATLGRRTNDKDGDGGEVTGP